FFTPASGKIHIAATMNTAVTITNIQSSRRIGEPPQKASTPATISAAAGDPALTSVGTANAPSLQFAPAGTPPPAPGRRGGPPRRAAQVLLHEPRIVAVEQVADNTPIEIRRPEQPVGDRERQIHVHLHHEPGVVVRGMMSPQRVDEGAVAHEPVLVDVAAKVH